MTSHVSKWRTSACVTRESNCQRQFLFFLIFTSTHFLHVWDCRSAAWPLWALMKCCVCTVPAMHGMLGPSDEAWHGTRTVYSSRLFLVGAPSYPVPSVGANRGSRRLTWWKISGNTNRATPASLPGRSGTDFWQMEFVTSTMSRRLARSAGFYATRLEISPSLISTRAASKPPRRPASPTTTYTLIPTRTPCRPLALKWAALLEYRWRLDIWAYPGHGLLRTPSATSSVYEPSWILQVRKTLRPLCYTREVFSFICSPIRFFNKPVRLVIIVFFGMMDYHVATAQPVQAAGRTMCPLQVVQASVSPFSQKAVSPLSMGLFTGWCVCKHFAHLLDPP